MQYKILSGDQAPRGKNAFEFLEEEVNAVLSSGGSTVGGPLMGRTGTPYQAVMTRNLNRANYIHNNSNTNAENGLHTGGKRKTRKHRR
jgi:hypothetical protein